MSTTILFIIQPIGSSAGSFGRPTTELIDQGVGLLFASSFASPEPIEEDLGACLSSDDSLLFLGDNFHVRPRCETKLASYVFRYGDLPFAGNLGHSRPPVTGIT